MTRTTAITNARIVTPEVVIDRGSVLVEGTRIVRVDRDVSNSIDATRVVDADGSVLIPGLVDLHGDDVESHLFPRSGARMPTELALTSADRFNVLQGITTKFHAIAFEDSPEDDRSIDQAREVVAAIASMDGFLADNRVHVRAELSSASVSAVENIVETGLVDLVSIMHHAPGVGQFDDPDAFRRRYEDRFNISGGQTQQLVEDRQSLSARSRRITAERIIDQVHSLDIPVASHDDETVDGVEWMANRGVTISEFPVTIQAARRATELDQRTVMGAPNLVRGGSLWGNLTVSEAINAGVLDILSSDYHPPSLLAAPFVDNGEPLPVRVARVTKNPAEAVGLTDRGRIVEGARADLVLVESEPTPTVQQVWVAGDCAISG